LEDAARKEDGEGGTACCVGSATPEQAAATLLTTM
jgi:hypothetical protein